MTIRAGGEFFVRGCCLLHRDFRHGAWVRLVRSVNLKDSREAHVIGGLHRNGASEQSQTTVWY